MNREKITELALAAGFEEKLLSNGEMGLREYVYAFANSVEAEGKIFIDSAIIDVKYFEKQRDDLIKALALINPSLNFVGWESGDGEPIGDQINSLISGANGDCHG